MRAVLQETKYFSQSDAMEFCRLDRSAASKIERLAYRTDYCSSRSKITKWCCCCRCQYRDRRRNIGSRSPVSCPWQQLADNSRDALATAINSIEFTRNYRRINWRFWFTGSPSPYAKIKRLTKDFVERFVLSFDLISYFLSLFFIPHPWGHPRVMLLLNGYIIMRWFSTVILLSFNLLLYN